MIEFTEGIYNFYVYILTNKAKKVLYTGMTNNLKRRLHEHKSKLNPNINITQHFVNQPFIEIKGERDSQFEIKVFDKLIKLTIFSNKLLS